MIAKRIYDGETAEQIGIKPGEYLFRKGLVDRFAAAWSGGDFERDFVEWLKTQPEGTPEGKIRNPMRKLEFVPMPSAITRGVNLSKALFRFVVEGFPVEEKPKALEKLAICEANDCGFFDGSVCRHQECGCFSKIKTFFLTEHCPLGKW